MNASRLEALRDGVIAISSTIVVLRLRLPRGGQFSGPQRTESYVNEIDASKTNPYATKGSNNGE